jgi:hypothetical protein
MAIDIDRFREDLIYRVQAPLAAVLEDLEFLRGFDRDIEAQHQKWYTRGQAGVIGGGITAAALLFIFAPTMLLGLAGVGAGMYCHYRALGFHRLNLPDRRYELLTQVLTRLQPDIASAEPVTVRLDFQPSVSPAKRVKEHKVGVWDATDYVDPWLSLRVRLKDGTHLLLSMAERVQQRERYKRSASGKQKKKQKSKGSALIQVRLRVKPERHPRLEGLGPRAWRAAKLPRGAALARLRVARDGLSMRARLPLEWRSGAVTGRDVPRTPADEALRVDASRTVLMMLLSLYQVLNYSTALRKRAAARATP